MMRRFSSSRESSLPKFSEGTRSSFMKSPSGSAGSGWPSVLGLAYVPEERKTDGLFLTRSVIDNVVVTALRRFTRLGLLSLALPAACLVIRMAFPRCSTRTFPTHQSSGVSLSAIASRP
jgi:hypothetical protein